VIFIEKKPSAFMSPYARGYSSVADRVIHFASAADVKAFAAENSARCIVTFGSLVLDVTEYLAEHPGGDDVFEEFKRGDDITKAFNDVGHSASAQGVLKSKVIGKIVDASSAAQQNSGAATVLYQPLQQQPRALAAVAAAPSPRSLDAPPTAVSSLTWLVVGVAFVGVAVGLWLKYK
jgi:hypothetical protein